MDYYIKKASARLARLARYHQTQELGKAIARLNLLFYATMKVMDYQRALAVQREINQLLGLYPNAAGESPDNPIHLRIDDMTELFKMLQAHKESQT